MENTYVGPFLIIKKLGTNRRHQVYHARQTEQQRDVALKFISLPPNIAWESGLNKINLEVRELKKLEHPNLVKVFGAGVHEERIFFASELIESESLAAILSRRRIIPPDLTVEYGRQIADLLNYLHQMDLIHSKLNPEKILVTEDHQIKIADLRLNRSRRRRWDARRQRELDIAAYMAPENFTEGATARSDFYSLGVILYEMLTGKLPYPPDTLSRMTHSKLNSPVPSVALDVMNCPIWLDKIITQMLQPNPRKRPYSAQAIMLAFDEIKKIDVSHQAAVDQITDSFNALNAGADKAEARKLLGKKQMRQYTEIPPFWQSVPFMIAGLIVMLTFIVWMAMPPSIEKQLQQARELIASNHSADWIEARDKLKPIMKGDSPFADQAETLYYVSRRKTLVEYADRGVTNQLQTINMQLFGKAWQLQKSGRDQEAASIYQELIDSILPDSKEHYIQTEATAQLAKLQIDPPEVLPELSE